MPIRARWALRFAGGCAAMVGLPVARRLPRRIRRAGRPQGVARVLQLHLPVRAAWQRRQVRRVAVRSVPGRLPGSSAGGGRAGATSDPRRMRGRSPARRSGRHDVGAEACASRAIPGRSLAGSVPALSQRSFDRRDVTGARADPSRPGSIPAADRRAGGRFRRCGRLRAAHARFALSDRCVWRVSRRHNLGAAHGGRVVRVRGPSRPIGQVDPSPLAPGGAHASDRRTDRGRPFWPRSSCSATLMRSPRTCGATLRSSWAPR